MCGILQIPLKWSFKVSSYSFPQGTLLGFLQDMFSVSKVNYGSTRELAEDIIRIAQIRKREADEKLSW